MRRTSIQQRDGKYVVYDLNKCCVIRGPFPDRERAELEEKYAHECDAYVRASRENTRRELGYYYDPTD